MILFSDTLNFMMMMIAPNAHVREGGKERVEVKGKHGRIWREEEENADYGWKVQSSQ